MTTAHRMTYADFMTLPDDGYQYELVRGEILRMPPPKGEHGSIEAALVEAAGRYLHDRAVRLGWVESQGRFARDRLMGRVVCGEAGIRVSLPDDPDQVRGIDFGYLTPDQVARIGTIPADAYMPEAPALIAEVISPSETVTYIEDKVADYFAGGAQLVWLLFPTRRTARVCLPDGATFTVAADSGLDGGQILPGFSVVLANLFP